MSRNQNDEIKVLQVSGYESPGKRFNGITLASLLKLHGVHSTHLIWERDTKDPSVLSFDDKHTREINAMYARIEESTSMQSVLYQNLPQILRQPAFQAADLVHLHLVHTGYLTMADLASISRIKPTVWTLHDPWAFTGHCIYPFDCVRWKIGCGHCPDLGIHFPMREDNTAAMFAYKLHSYRKARFEVVVASRWMRDMATASPLFDGIRIHEVPFGLDLDFFSKAAGPKLRDRHGIPPDAIVLGFRAQHEFKGLSYIIAALDRIDTKRKICLLTFANKGLIDCLADRFQIVELGWVHDEALLRDAMAALDVFLMPSLQEAFGVMAIEAMACGKPVICFAGTSLPEVTHAPEIGLAVPMRDAEALARAIQRLIDSPQERLERGRAGRVLAECLYGEGKQAQLIADLYRDVIAGREDLRHGAAAG